MSLLNFPSLAALKTTFLNSMAVLEAPRAAECVPEPCLGGGVGTDAAAATAASAEGILRSSSTLYCNILDAELVSYDDCPDGIRFCRTCISRTTNERRINGQRTALFPVSNLVSVQGWHPCRGHRVSHCQQEPVSLMKSPQSRGSHGRNLCVQTIFLRVSSRALRTAD